MFQLEKFFRIDKKIFVAWASFENHDLERFDKKSNDDKTVIHQQIPMKIYIYSSSLQMLWGLKHLLE